MEENFDKTKHPNTGTWLRAIELEQYWKTRGSNKYFCSNCGFILRYDEDQYKITRHCKEHYPVYSIYKFCPHCGILMVEK